MSWKASGYVKELVGMSRSEKLLLLILADYYQEEEQCAWPSVSRLAKETMLKERHVYKLIHSLEVKGFLRVAHYSGGRTTNRYTFPNYTPVIRTGDVPQDRGALSFHSNRTVSEPSTEEEERDQTHNQVKPSDIFNEILVCRPRGRDYQWQIDNWPAYDAAFVGDLDEFPATELVELVWKLDTMRQKFFAKEAPVPAPLLIPGVGELRALFPVAKFVAQRGADNFMLHRAMRDIWDSGISPGGNNILSVVAKNANGFLSALAVV